jgi:hypothetical protein
MREYVSPTLFRSRYILPCIGSNEWLASVAYVVPTYLSTWVKYLGASLLMHVSLKQHLYTVLYLVHRA